MMQHVPMRRILVGYDGSEGGRRALDRAVAEARPHRRLTVLSVLNIPLDPGVPRNFGRSATSRPAKGLCCHRRRRWSRT